MPIQAPGRESDSAADGQRFIGSKLKDNSPMARMAEICAACC
ncbi:protein of unknown function [Denitratisoma oestradiolicum]|uniref:Uncharacterized protein n=1 Tax=Denitratisoma oestradiolicum TaxID=311182 RepID=A0A6S6XZV3_9PROT|nr:protein of unknown function [Denitratisoma oestradiolicum]